MIFIPSIRINLARDLAKNAPNNIAAERRAKALAIARDVSETTATDFEKEGSNINKYYDKKRTDKHFNIGDEVILVAKNIRTLRASKKLAN